MPTVEETMATVALKLYAAHRMTHQWPARMAGNMPGIDPRTAHKLRETIESALADLGDRCQGCGKPVAKEEKYGNRPPTYCQECAYGPQPQ